MLRRIMIWMRGWTCPACQTYNPKGNKCSHCGAPKPK